MNRSLVVTKFIGSTYDKGLWTQWQNPWVKGGYLGIGTFAGSGLDSADPDSQKDFMLGSKTPYKDWTFELTRYWGQGKPSMHFLEGMVQYQHGPWWGTAEYWTGGKHGKVYGEDYDGAYALLRYNIDGNLWTSNRYEYLHVVTPSGAAATTRAGARHRRPQLRAAQERLAGHGQLRVLERRQTPRRTSGAPSCSGAGTPGSWAASTSSTLLLHPAPVSLRGGGFLLGGR